MAATDLEPAELAYLLGRLEQSVLGGYAKMRRRTIAMSAFCVAGALAAVAAQQWFGVGISALLATSAASLGTQSMRRAAAEQTRPVLDAVRDAPERIRLVRHHRPRYAPVEHWLEITTKDSRLTVEGKDWQRLYSALQRRCPAATFVDD